MTVEEIIKCWDNEYFNKDDAKRIVDEGNDLIESFTVDIQREKNKIEAVRIILEKRGITL